MILPQAIHSYSHTLKTVQECDIDVIKEWLIAYHIEALGDDVNNPTLEQSIIDEIQDTQLSQNRWILFVNNTPVGSWRLRVEG